MYCYVHAFILSIFSARWLLLSGLSVELLGYIWMIVMVGGAEPGKKIKVGDTFITLFFRDTMDRC